MSHLNNLSLFNIFGKRLEILDVLPITKLSIV